MRIGRALSFLCTLTFVAGLMGTASAAPAVNRQLWAKVLETGNGNRLALSPDGSTVYVTGCSSLCGNDQMLTVAYTVSTGLGTWTAGLTGARLSAANDVTVSPDGKKIYVTGWAQYSGSDYADYETIAYQASTGVQLWAARYDVPGFGIDRAYRVRVSPDGTRVFVTGESWTDATRFDFATIAYDATSGTQLWVARYNGTGGDDSPTGLGVSPDGTKVFVTGGSFGSDGTDDFATIAYDAASGTQLWLTRSTDGAATPTDLVVSPDGDQVFVTGCGGGDFDICVDAGMVTASYDAATGTQLWMETYGPPPGGHAEALAIGVSPDGSLVFVTGYRSDGTTSAYVTAAYDAGTGSQTWLKIYTGGVNPPAVAYALAVSGDGSRLIVTGSSGDGLTGSQTYTTIAYAPTTGHRLWSATFTGTGAYAVPSSVVVTKNGQVAIVTGTTIGPDGNYDWGTAAYRS